MISGYSLVPITGTRELKLCHYFQHDLQYLILLHIVWILVKRGNTISNVPDYVNYAVSLLVYLPYYDI